MTLAAFGVSLEGPYIPRINVRPQGISLAVASARAEVAGPPEWLLRDGDAFEVGWGGVARYRIWGPPSPRAEIVAQGDPFTAILGFLISVLPLALPLFGLEPLHGSAVAAGSRTVAFLGNRRAGKSAVATALIAGGATFLTDDACAFDADGLLWPGSPLLAGRAPAPPSVGTPVGIWREKKVVLAVRHDPAPRPLDALIFLDPSPGSGLRLARLAPGETIRKLLANVRAPMVLPESRRSLQFRVVSALAALPAWTAGFDPAAQDYEVLAPRLLDAVTGEDSTGGPALPSPASCLG